MCGRYALSRPASELAQLFEAREGHGLPGYQPSFNLAPTRTVPGLVVAGDGIRVLVGFRWGLVPAWARDRSIGNRLFNARAETLERRPAFADALQGRRMAIVADGFYEWRVDGRRHQPFYFCRPDGQQLLFAGLWEAWRGHRSPQESLLSCAIVTTEAGEDMDGVHDRMPAILPARSLDTWLQPGPIGRLDRAQLLRPAPPGTLVHHPVDPRVGDVRHDDPHLVAPFTPPVEPEPLRLFSVP